MPVKTARKKLTPEVEKNPIIEDSSKEGQQKRNNRIFYVKIIGVLAVVAIIAFLLKSVLMAVIVDNRPIWRLTLVKELEKQAGKQVLEGLIANAIILGEADKKKIVILAKDIDAEVLKIESSLVSQGQTLDQVLELQGMTKDDLKNQLKLKLIVDKLAGDNISVTDKEVDSYIAENKYTIPDDSKKAEAKEAVKAQLRQQKINEKAQKIFADLKAKAKIIYLLNF